MISIMSKKWARSAASAGGSSPRWARSAGSQRPARRPASAKAQDSLAEERRHFRRPAAGRWTASSSIPRSGKHPGVILWPDIAGLRERPKAMARRLAGAGLCGASSPTPITAAWPAQQFADFEDFAQRRRLPEGRPVDGEEARPKRSWRRQGSGRLARRRRTRSIPRKGIGTQGYCMTGGWTHHDRGGGARTGSRRHAASMAPGWSATIRHAPVNLLDDLAPDAQALIASPERRRARADRQGQAARGGREGRRSTLEIEVYDGDHGWTVLDSPVYDEARGRARLGQPAGDLQGGALSSGAQTK